MALEIKHVADLMRNNLTGNNYNFRIPSYQRGYRWERKQIEQLLDDLAEFSDSILAARKLDQDIMLWNQKNPNNEKKANNEQVMGYYCLQPLAVSQQDNLPIDVIDGQQRLTTIYLILYYLSRQPNSSKLPYDLKQNLDDALFSLQYETRDDAFFTNKQFSTNPGLSSSNIDFYYMTLGYQVIENWFQKSNKHNEILKLLLPDSYQPNDSNGYNTLLHDVRFIWYETPAEKAIETFKNLNYGKIGLTASELVKALLFECDRYEHAIRNIEKGVAFARSLKWSAMEEKLQNDYFWGMLSPKAVEQDLHLELILSFVASDIDKKQKYSLTEGWNNNDEDWVFNIISKAIADNTLCDAKGNQLTSVTQRIEYLWNYIQKTYTIFLNWYEDRSLYHRIGYYIFVSTHYFEKKHKDVIRELYMYYLSMLKTDFEIKLDELIGKSIRITTTIKDSKKDEKGNDVEYDRIKKLDELKYGEDDNAIRKILLLFNIEMTLLNSQDEPRFPFHLASAAKFDLKSIEHIHPQNLDNDDIKFEVLKDWYKDRKIILQSKYDLCDPKNIDLKNAIQNLETNLVDEKTFQNNKSLCLSDLAVIDKKFDDLAGMNQTIMHTLYNLALVDVPTNSELSNKLLDAKRQILINRTEQEITYVPLGTWYAFNKHFSNDVKDLKFWSMDDRTAYFNAIKSVYEKYTK